MVLKADLLDQALDGQPLDPLAVIREPLIVHEAMPVFTVLERFKQKPVRLAIILNEYGSLEGIVTQADLLEAIAGDLPDVEGEEPDIVRRRDGSLLIDGMTPAHDAFGRPLLVPSSSRQPLLHAGLLKYRTPCRDNRRSRGQTGLIEAAPGPASRLCIFRNKDSMR